MAFAFRFSGMDDWRRIAFVLRRFVAFEMLCLLFDTQSGGLPSQWNRILFLGALIIPEFLLATTIIPSKAISRMRHSVK